MQSNCLKPPTRNLGDNAYARIMDFMAFVWIVAELISCFGKKEFSQRMKTGAKWSVALASLSAYGSMGESKDSLMYLASVIFMLAIVALPIYYFRLWGFNFIKKRFYKNPETEQEPKQDIGKMIAFQLTNGLTQFVSVVAGFYVGILIYSLVVGATMLGKYSLSG